jgi:hypothetical protein
MLLLFNDHSAVTPQDIHFSQRDVNVHFAPREYANYFVPVVINFRLTDENGNPITDENGNHFVLPTSIQARPVIINFKQRDTSINFTE